MASPLQEAACFQLHSTKTSIVATMTHFSTGTSGSNSGLQALYLLSHLPHPPYPFMTPFLCKKKGSQGTYSEGSQIAKIMDGKSLPWKQLGLPKC